MNINNNRASLLKYMPHALGLGAVGLGAYHLMKPKGFWEQAGNTLGGLGSSIGDLSSDLVGFAQGNPHALGAMARNFVPEGMMPPTGIPNHPIATQPVNNTPMHQPPPQQTTAPTLGEMRAYQDQVMNFSPYGY